MDFIEHPEQAGRTVWTARAFHGYLQEHYQIECFYQTVVRFFHDQNFALKVPQPWSDRQDETLRQTYREHLKLLHEQTDAELWFMDETDCSISSHRTRNVMILDNASWHRSQLLNWHEVEPLFHPPYSPDVNPIERIWLVMKNKWSNAFHTRDQDALIERLDQAILDVIHHPEHVQNTASIRTLL